MNEITLASGERTVSFSNRDISIDGKAYPYSGMTRLWHLPDRSAYAFQCSGETVALPYEEKDGPLMQALLERIGKALDLPIEECHSQEAGNAAEEPAGPASGSAEPKKGIFSDKRFVIELIAGIVLIILGIIGFVLWR